MSDRPAPFMTPAAHLEHLERLELSIVASMLSAADSHSCPADGETAGQLDLRLQNFASMREGAAQHQERAEAVRAAAAALVRNADADRLKLAVRWALGEDVPGPEFERPPGNAQPFWWRRTLRRLSGLDGSAAPAAAAPSPPAPSRFARESRARRIYESLRRGITLSGHLEVLLEWPELPASERERYLRAADALVGFEVAA